jgi:nicotinamide mononucleotide transporter
MADALSALLERLLRDPIEVTAVAFGILSVWLSTREHIASWPTALVNVSLFFIIFARARLYAGMGLQVVYFALSVYGWYQWKFGGADRTTLPVSRTPRRTAAILAVLGVTGTAAVATYLHRATDAALPFLDSGLAVFSLLAQWMMTRKLLENWLVWILLDVTYVGMYLSRGLALTAVNYAVYLGLATLGFFQWRRSLRAAAATVAAGA